MREKPWKITQKNHLQNQKFIVRENLSIYTQISCKNKYTYDYMSINICVHEYM